MGTERLWLILIALLAVLFLGQLFTTESFRDISGSMINLSVSDLMSLIALNYSAPPAAASKTVYRDNSLGVYNSIKDSILYDVKKAVRDEVVGNLGSSYANANAASSSNVITDSCIDSAAALQGSDFMRYIPGKNPDDYIRKDSVPCYGCSIP